MYASALEGTNDTDVPKQHPGCGHLCARIGPHQPACCRCREGTPICSACVRDCMVAAVHQYSGPKAAQAMTTVLHGLDHTSITLSPRALQERNDRLDSHVRILYHQTSPAAARAILDSRFQKGKSGSCDFAETPEDTDRKAITKGDVLKVRVRLGRCLILHKPKRHVTFQSLHQRGFDSVLIDCFHGLEWVVYHPDQAVPLEIVKR